jgi:arsenate reductase (thioredoxin)
MPRCSKRLRMQRDLKSSVHREVHASLLELGIDLNATTPQKLDARLASEADYLITMGCGEACPVVVGAIREDWPLPAPQGLPLDQVRAIREAIRQRVRAFVAAHGWSPAAVGA